MLPMQSGELGRWHAAATAVRPDLVVVLPPGSDDSSGLGQSLEPMLVQALIAELAVEALDVAVLHRPARFDQDVANPMRYGYKRIYVLLRREGWQNHKSIMALPVGAVVV
jgi:hypothetical protein